MALGRGRRTTVRVFAALDFLTFGFMLVFIVGDAANRVGVEQVLEPPGSLEARIGADHPGEILHLTGAPAGLVIGAIGLLGLALRPERAGSAYHTAAAATAMLLAVAVLRRSRQLWRPSTAL